MSDPNENIETPMEVLQPSALHALERAQIDTQVATAHQYPRSIELFRKRAMSMATLDEETAESCIYCRPVGKQQDAKTGQWVEKFAEGPSIRLAEIVGCSYGNLRVASRIIEQTPRFVKCEGVCHDLESNYAGKSEIVEATVTRHGEPYSERQRALTAKVALAKAYRDAIFKVVPRALCKPVLEQCKIVAKGEGKPIEERRKKARAWIATLKISEARVFAALNVQGWADVGEDHLTVLTGLKTAINDGDQIDEVFPEIAKAPEQQAGPAIPPESAKMAQSAATAAKKAPVKAAEKAPEKPTAPKAEEKAPEPTETPQDAPKAPEGEKTPPTPAEAPPAPNGAAQQPLSEEEKEELAAAGLGQPETPEITEGDPRLAEKSSDTEGVKSLKLLARRAGVAYVQLWGWLRKMKLAKDDQTDLNQLSTGKIDSLLRHWDSKVHEIKAIQE